MTEDKILKKYGDRKMTFVSLDRHIATYKSLTGDVTCTFVVEYRDTIENEMLLRWIITYGYDRLKIEVS